MKEPMFEPVVITTTSNNIEVLNSIGKRLVEKKLAACVQISGPITSYYVWHGKTETSVEWSCSIKSSKTLFPEIEKLVLELHNYDQPELIVVEIVAGSAAYLQWMNDSLKVP